MRITVEGTIYDYLLEVSRKEFLGDGRRVKRIQLLAAHSGQLATLNKAEGQYSFRGIITVNCRSCQQLEVSHLSTNEPGVISLQPEIEFLAQATFQLTHNL